jgi:hypothetical protein
MKFFEVKGDDFPIFIIEMDKAPEKRFTEVILHFKDELIKTKE